MNDSSLPQTPAPILNQQDLLCALRELKQLAPRKRQHAARIEALQKSIQHYLDNNGPNIPEACLCYHKIMKELP